MMVALLFLVACGSEDEPDPPYVPVVDQARRDAGVGDAAGNYRCFELVCATGGDCHLVEVDSCRCDRLDQYGQCWTLYDCLCSDGRQSDCQFVTQGCN